MSTIPSLEHDSHTDEERFWREFALVMCLPSTGKEGAFCVGVVAALAARRQRFPSMEIMHLAAREEPLIVLSEVAAAGSGANRSAGPEPTRALPFSPVDPRPFLPRWTFYGADGVYLGYADGDVVQIDTAPAGTRYLYDHQEGKAYEVTDPKHMLMRAL